MIKKDITKLEKKILGTILVIIGILGLLLNLVVPLFTDYLPNLDVAIILSINILWILIGVYIIE